MKAEGTKKVNHGSVLRSPALRDEGRITQIDADFNKRTRRCNRRNAMTPRRREFQPRTDPTGLIRQRMWIIGKIPQSRCSLDLARRRHVTRIDRITGGDCFCRINRTMDGGCSAGMTDIRDNIGFNRCIRALFPFFQDPLLLGAVNLTQIVDAGVHLGSGSGPD